MARRLLLRHAVRTIALAPLAAFVAVVVAACGGKAADIPPGSTTPSPTTSPTTSPTPAPTSPTTPTTPTTPDPACSVENVTGAVPGVSISIYGDACTVHVGHGTSFRYVITLGSGVPPITVDSSANCMSPRADDPGSFVRWVITGTSDAGHAQQYCECDVGLCASPASLTLQPTAGTSKGAIDWPGNTWSGPSDTGNPLGPFFEAGSYFVEVTFDGFSAGQVTAKLPIRVLP